MNLEMAELRHNQSLEVELTDVSGRVVLSHSNDLPQKQVSLDVSEIPGGAYFVTLKQGEIAVSKPLIITDHE